MKTFRSKDEADRIAALERYQILDTAAEEQFDHLTQLAALVCQSPISLLSFVAEDRRWVKSCVGLNVRETSRDLSFCAEAINQTGLLVVEDARLDPRFRDNPQVKKEPGIRFYTGAPLRTSDGFAIGALCVMDRVPRVLTPEQQKALRWIADQAMTELELRRNLRKQALSTARQRQSEEAQREAEARSRTILENAVDAIITLDQRGTIESFNPAAARLSGFSEEQMLGGNIEKVIARRGGGQLELPTLKAGAAPAKPVAAEIVRRDGERVPLELIFSASELGNKRIVTAIGRDVSLRENIARQLAKSNSLLTALRSALHEFIGRTDPTVAFDGLLKNLLKLTDSEYGFIGEVLETEKGERFLRTHALTNIAWNEETRELYEQYAPNLEFHNLDTLFGACLTTGKPVVANKPDTDPRRGGRPDGHPPLRSFLGIPCVQAGHMVGMVGIANREGGYDLELVEYLEPFLATCAYIIEAYRSDQNRQEAEISLLQRTEDLSRANAELARANRLKDEFLASMSHELRTPLTGILGLAEALQLRVFGPVNEKQNTSLLQIESSGRHLLELINDILDLSKVEAGHLEMNLSSVSAHELCDSCLTMVRQMAQKKLLSVETSIGSEDLWFRGDARRLKQMLVNLLSNAVKFTPERGKIGLDVTKVDGAIRFTIWDNGIGIRKEDLGKLFRPFAQLDSRLSRGFAGTGLGLALVKHLARLHGGGVSVQSEIGKGTRFTVEIPTAEKTDVLDQSHKVKKAGGNPSPIRRPLGGDELAQQLRALGFDVLSHWSVEGGLARAKQIKPVGIVIESEMPDGSGIDLLRRLKEDRETASIPIVMLIASDDERPIKDLGAEAALAKPVSLMRLEAILGSIAGEGKILLLASPNPVRKPLVILAEDNEVNVTLFTEFIRTLGCQVAVARNGREVIALASEREADLILMDIQMPEMDGLEAIQRLRADPNSRLARVPIVALTALAMVGDRDRCLSVGADDYLTKPISLETLGHTIERYLDRVPERAHAIAQ